MTIFEKKYDLVQLWAYANETKKRVNNLLKSIKAMNADYYFISDINNFSCISAIKQKLSNKYNYLDNNKIIVIIMEIESWYLSGLSKESETKLKVKSYDSTDGLSKETFNRVIPSKFSSRIDFIQEILKCFNINIAVRKNKSFNYFFNKSQSNIDMNQTSQ